MVICLIKHVSTSGLPTCIYQIQQESDGKTIDGFNMTTSVNQLLTDQRADLLFLLFLAGSLMKTYKHTKDKVSQLPDTETEEELCSWWT